MKKQYLLNKWIYKVTLLLSLLRIIPLYAQTITGNLSLLANQSIKLEGFAGLKTYPISTATIDNKGDFVLRYSQADYGVGYLLSADNKPYFLILSGEDIDIAGESLSYIETMRVIKGQENRWFVQYASQQPKREQALSAWAYLENLYQSDTLFLSAKKTRNSILLEKQRLQTEEQNFLNKLPNASYAKWYLPTRKLVSSVSVIAQYRSSEIPGTIAAFRKLDYTDSRLYKSGLFKDAIESHFWLIENSGISIDDVALEMKKSIDDMLRNLIKDNKKLNEVTNYLFDLLERHSLFQASEYLALKVLNETSCTIDNDLAKQLESYRAMKKGNVAPEIQFGEFAYLSGSAQHKFKNLADLQSTYTLLVFGASWCPKCNEELPQIVQNYAKWQNNGVEVVYVSLDTDVASFHKSVAQYPFLVYCDLQKWNSPVVQDYYVFGTPTMYLLDNDRKILLRPNSVKQMDAWVDWFLVQGNK
jgi:thiol-disulfide isomerase/thioredoxin